MKFNWFIRPKITPKYNAKLKTQRLPETFKQNYMYENKLGSRRAYAVQNEVSNGHRSRVRSIAFVAFRSFATRDVRFAEKWSVASWSIKRIRDTRGDANRRRFANQSASFSTSPRFNAENAPVLPCKRNVAAFQGLPARTRTWYAREKHEQWAITDNISLWLANQVRERCFARCVFSSVACFFFLFLFPRVPALRFFRRATSWNFIYSSRFWNP